MTLCLPTNISCAPCCALLLPGRVLVEDYRVSHDYQQGPCSGHVHVESPQSTCIRINKRSCWFHYHFICQGRSVMDLFIWQESNVEVFVHLDIVDAAADGGDHDDLPLLSLKLLHRPHLMRTNRFSAKLKNVISNSTVVTEHDLYLLNYTRAQKERDQGTF